MTFKILVIDDEIALLKIMKRFLEKLNFIPELADTGEKGLALFKENPAAYEVLIIDFNLPDQTNSEFLPLLRSINPDVKLVLTTGYAVEEIAQEFSHIRLDGTLQKPFTFTDLKNLLESLLQ